MADTDRTDDAEELEGRTKAAYLQGADWEDDLDAFAAPLHWPSITSVEYRREMDSLRRWVQELVERFEHLDQTVIPSCWWRHNGHVEALTALRDHERGAYTESSPSKDAVDWHRAFVVIEARLREWTGWLACASGHREPIRPMPVIDPDEWDAYTHEEQRRRERREVGAATDN